MTNQPEFKPCRAAFEAWYDTTPSRAIERNGERYILMQTELSWCAWQAAWNTRAEPAAPSSDVGTDLDSVECFVQCYGGEFECDLLKSTNRIRAHIAALEADVLRLNGDCSNYLLVKIELEADNKRLRDGLERIVEHDWRSSDVGNGPFRNYGKYALIAKEALAQTDEKVR